jgi:hypothetical protein
MRVIRDVLGLAFPLGVTRMDAYSTDAADPGYSDLPPVLLCASSDAAMARAARTVQASGLRIGAKLTIEHASERLDQQIAASAIWVELDRDCGGAMDDLLNRISRDVTDGRYAAIVSASAGLLDPVVAGIEDFAVELVVGAGDAERAAALATATARRALPLKFSDVAADNNAERLRQLSEEVSRIASTLARLSAGPGSPPRVLEPAVAGDVPPLAAETVRNVIRARRLRALFPGRAVRRSRLGHASRPVAGRDSAAARARVEPVHRRGRARDNGASLAQDACQPRSVRPPRRPA